MSSACLSETSREITRARRCDRSCVDPRCAKRFGVRCAAPLWQGACVRSQWRVPGRSAPLCYCTTFSPWMVRSPLCRTPPKRCYARALQSASRKVDRGRVHPRLRGSGIVTRRFKGPSFLNPTHTRIAGGWAACATLERQPSPSSSASSTCPACGSPGHPRPAACPGQCCA